jgi:hypothetical protein
MHRVVRSAALALVLLVASAAGVAAGARTAATGASDLAGPFEGTFEGTALGSGGTTAPLTLALTQRGTEVSGTVSLGEGLYVATAACGGAPVPAGTVQGSGQTPPDDLRHVRVQTSLRVQGVAVPVSLAGDLSPDGQTITAVAALDVPAFCGPDPEIPSTLQRTAGDAAPAA